MKIEEIYTLIEDDMTRVNLCIQKKLRSEVVLIDQIGQYIVHSGGKRLRPILHLLAANAFQYEGDEHIECATLIEFIHTATLLHDDVVDASELRRGKETANALFGNEASVLVGDFLYSRAFQMMVQLNKMRIMDILANATNTIAEGEVQQLLNVHDPDTSEARYLQVIHDKTAKLFESATQLAALLSLPPQRLPVPVQDLRGSYAGAMGWSQFMPLSLQHYGIDGNGDGRIDLWNSLPDILASTANYLAAHGWQRGQPVAMPAVLGKNAAEVPVQRSKTLYAVEALEAKGYAPSVPVAPELPATLLTLQGVYGPEYWITFANFAVITHYNRSPLYAMAVTQLAAAIQRAAAVSSVRPGSAP